MTRRISKTGKRYTQGSHTTFEHYPRVCAAGPDCQHGGRIVMSHQAALWFETREDGIPRSWHFDCRTNTKGGDAQ